MKKTKAALLAVTIALFLTTILVAICVALEWYQLSPTWVVFETLFLCLFFITIGCGCYFKLIRVKKNTVREKEEAQQFRQVLSQYLSDTINKHPRCVKNIYAVPWYVQLTEKTPQNGIWLQQMGFEWVEPTMYLNTEPDNSGKHDINSSRETPVCGIQCWVSETAIIVTLDLSLGKESLLQTVNLLLKQMSQKRARQMFNGAICSVSLSSLIESSELSVSELSQKYRAVLELCNQKTGLTLPTYCVFNDLAAIRDLYESFAGLDETQREQPLGDLRAVTDSPEYDNEWFVSSFDGLVKSLANLLSYSLKQQLNAHYREASVAGVFQLSALRYELEDFMTQTFSPHQFALTALNFRGYFLIHGGGESSALDLISAMHASELGFDSLSVRGDPQKRLSLFAKRLVSQVIIKESALVGVNKKREFSYRALRTGVATGAILMLCGFVALIRAEYQFQRGLDAQALTLLSQYKANLAENPIQPDDLASPVYSLFELREITLLYRNANPPWYIQNVLPSSSIYQAVNSAYYRELESELLVLMRDYIMKDMFVYNSLDDKVKTLELLNYQQLLYDQTRHSTQSLVDYFVGALKEEGSGEANLVSRFQLLANDVLATDAVPPPFDEALLGLVRNTLSSNDLGELLYQHILQHDDFSRRIDLRSQLSPMYRKVFQFKQGSDYLIPFAYTREGFEALSNETGFQLASNAITAYEGVMGRIRGDAEMSRINRQLRERYIADYIQYWGAFIDAVSLTPVTSWGESEQQIQLVTNAHFSPLKQLYRLIENNTNLLNVLNQEKGLLPAPSKGLPNEATENSRALESESTQPLANRASMARVAETISAPFRHIHSLVNANQTTQSAFDIAIAHFIALDDWLAKSKERQFKGHYFIEQLQAQDTSNPVAQLAALSRDYSVPLLPQLMQQNAILVNQLALEAVRDIINQDWLPLHQFYQLQFSQHYPFSERAQTDAALDDVAYFFKPNGAFDTFASKYAARFDVSGDELVIRGFIPHQYLPMSTEYVPFKQAVTTLQRQLFTGEELGFQFSLRAHQMSPMLTRFALMTQLPLFEYQNGPKLWQTQSWPMPANQIQSIVILLEDSLGEVGRAEQTGPWSWFKVASKMEKARSIGQLETAWRYQDDDNEVNLVVKFEGRDQPFDTRLFTRLAIPERL
ncbi:type VI secretion system membrane subunit TssM [Vibrio sp. SM6]|uniref:Type VI secretion system membrane subunit TssM n=1 Tax=Vibrio agarilyticus TaxID=2726741 RepID=A0A7X8YFP6_9VIBR|nr:type VI secretion protein IcmF/TssM N-terminal domain-containing protein [Vibrio agarilyticus]NLS11770.1 type VI secretion system membrane subunit TssM [Vibrio agarilyticus]